MSKRTADYQINDRDFDTEPSDGSESFKPFKKAPEDVMKSRKILKPKMRQSGQKPIKSIPNLFNPTPSTDNKKDTLIKALNDSVVEHLLKINKPNMIADFTPVFNKYIDSYGKIQRGEIDTGAAGATGSGAAAVIGSVAAPTSGFSFGATAPAKTAPAPAPVGPTPAAVAAAASDSDSESEKEDIKLTGPQFTLLAKPQIKNSPFSFGPKKEKPKDDSDSESEVEIKGPVFTFNKTIKDDVFKLKSENKPASNSTETTAAPASKPAFSFGKTADSNAEKPAFSFSGSKVEDKEKPTGFSFTKPEAEGEKKTFSFGNTDKPSFGFNKPAESSQPTASDEKLKPTFNFGASSDKPAFSFNSTPASNSSDKPAFSFGTSKDSSDKPAFSFGSSTTKADDKPAEKPTFSFGSAATKAEDKLAEKPAFSFGSAATKADEKPAEKPAFSFGSSAAKTDDKTEKPAFSFGNKPNDTADKPAFSFEAKSDDKPAGKPAFSFGNSSEKPAFSFGSSLTDKPADKPTFSFGQTDKSNDKPAFSFGQSEKKESDKPAFSFGQSEKKDSDKPAFSFGAAPSFSFNTSKTETPKADTNLEDKVEDANGNGEEESTANFEPVAQLNDKIEGNTGEENETVEYTKRAKLMLYEKEKNPPYSSKGVGELKLLKHKETGKSRLLMRADGGLRVLLNLAIPESFKYDSMGDGLVRFPSVNASQGLDTYVIKVKTKDDGIQLTDKLNELKK